MDTRKKVSKFQTGIEQDLRVNGWTESKGKGQRGKEEHSHSQRCQAPDAQGFEGPWRQEG